MQEKVFRVLINKLCKDVTGSPFHLKTHISWLSDCIIAKIYISAPGPHGGERLASIEMQDGTFRFTDASFGGDYISIPMADPEFIDKLTAELQKRWDNTNK